MQICRTCFADESTAILSPQLRVRRWLTISDIGVGETPNHQSLQGFFASFEARQPDRSTQAQSEKRKHMSAFHREKVLSVRHWTDTLFSFTATRNSGFRFQNGQFAMIGLEVDGRPLLRAYSMASANHEEALEFFSHQGRRRAADLAAAEDQGRRHHPGRAQGDRHADRRQSDPGQAPAAAVDRHGSGAVREPDQGSRRLRAVRDHRAGARLPAGLRTRLWRRAGGEAARRRIVRAAADREARRIIRPSPASRSATAAASPT